MEARARDGALGITSTKKIIRETSVCRNDVGFRRVRGLDFS